MGLDDFKHNQEKQVVDTNIKIAKLITNILLKTFIKNPFCRLLQKG